LGAVKIFFQAKMALSSPGSPPSSPEKNDPTPVTVIQNSDSSEQYSTDQ